MGPPGAQASSHAAGAMLGCPSFACRLHGSAQGSMLLLLVSGPVPSSTELDRCFLGIPPGPGVTGPVAGPAQGGGRRGSGEWVSVPGAWSGLAFAPWERTGHTAALAFSPTALWGQYCVIPISQRSRLRLGKEHLLEVTQLTTIGVTLRVRVCCRQKPGSSTVLNHVPREPPNGAKKLGWPGGGSQSAAPLLAPQLVPQLFLMPLPRGPPGPSLVGQGGSRTHKAFDA